MLPDFLQQLTKSPWFFTPFHSHLAVCTPPSLISLSLTPSPWSVTLLFLLIIFFQCKGSREKQTLIRWEEGKENWRHNHALLFSLAPRLKAYSLGINMGFVPFCLFSVATLKGHCLQLSCCSSRINPFCTHSCTKVKITDHKDDCTSCTEWKCFFPLSSQRR